MSLLARYKALPRAGKWSVWALGGLVLYFGVVETALAFSARVRGEADALEVSLKSRKAVAERATNTAGELEQNMVALGMPALPRQGDPVPALDRRITTVLSSHGVTPRRREPRPSAPVLTGPGQREVAKIGPAVGVQRVAVDLNLECDTEQLAKILRDLEAAPEVTAISRLSIRKLGDGRANDQKLGVTMSVEAWSLQSDSGKPLADQPEDPPTSGPTDAPTNAGEGGAIP